MKPIVKKILIIAAILIAILLIWFFFFHKETKPVTVLAEKPTTGYIAQSVTATGKIEPVDTVTVGTQISGILKYLYADFNSKVKKGELLAELDKSNAMRTHASDAAGYFVAREFPMRAATGERPGPSIL